MTTWAILASGPSMTQEIADYVRGKCNAVAVSDAYRLAPWADVLVSNDVKWWHHHPDALKFAGEKYSGFGLDGVKRIKKRFPYGGTQNSGLQGMRIAQEKGATKILLLGFDMHGTHFFGPHPEPLRNTTAERFGGFLKQFNRWDGCKVINCTPGSSLKKFPFADLREVLP